MVMAERYLPLAEVIPAPLCPEGLDMNAEHPPKPGRSEIMQRIGEKALLGWQPELEADILSSEAISFAEDERGNIDVKFKQYQRHYASDRQGMLHSSGWSGTETIRILNVHWDATSQATSLDYVDARNFRYQLIEHESLKRAGQANHLQALSQELWSNPYIES